MKTLILTSLVTGLLASLPAAATQAPVGIRVAVQNFLKARGGMPHTLPNFVHALGDLNGDGKADAVVMLTGPNWCGSGGCTLLVFQAQVSGYRLVSVSTVTELPVRMGLERSKGWKNLIVSSRGKGEVVMRFDGKVYPANPSLQPQASPAQIKAAQLLLK